MKTPKPQPVTIRPYGGGFSRSMFAESPSGTARMLYNIAIYDESGIICHVDLYDFAKLPKKTETEHIKMSIPITWKTCKKADYTEARAHLVACDDAGTRKYLLMIPAESVTLAKGNQIINRPIGEVEQLYDVEGIPAKFVSRVFHPFDRYAMIEEFESLSKDAYQVLTADAIVKPWNRERIAQFVARIEEYTAEAERIHSEDAAEYVRECRADSPRFDFCNGCFYRISSAKEAQR